RGGTGETARLPTLVRHRGAGRLGREPAGRPRRRRVVIDHGGGQDLLPRRPARPRPRRRPTRGLGIGMSAAVSTAAGAAAAVLVRGDSPQRAAGDRLELLTALVNGPRFDPLMRGEVLAFPPDHPTYRWGCLVAGCERECT